MSQLICRLKENSRPRAVFPIKQRDITDRYKVKNDLTNKME